MMSTTSDNILSRLKGLRARMRTGEQPLFTIPAIWENATDHQSHACDLVLTNQRVFGYIYTTFPRERLFLDAIELDAITAVSIRTKSFGAMFRELLVSNSQKRIYIRATSKKIEDTYTALRAAITEYTPARREALSGSTADAGSTATTQGQAEARRGDEAEDQQKQVNASPIYSRQRVRQSLERSPLGITLLLVGGLILEIIGLLAWVAARNAQAGLPLILAGILAVVVAIFARRQLR
ncbi:MAG TPA: hypothetical protein VF458_03135 [Ktedonobacteraceae bacterium]